MFHSRTHTHTHTHTHRHTRAHTHTHPGGRAYRLYVIRRRAPHVQRVTRQAPQPLPKQWFGDYLVTLVPACGQTPSSQQEGERGDSWPRSSAKGLGSPLSDGRESATPEPLGKTKWHSSLSPKSPLPFPWVCQTIHTRGEALCSPNQGLPANADKLIVVRTGLATQSLSANASNPIMVRIGPPQCCGMVPHPEAVPGVCLGTPHHIHTNTHKQTHTRTRTHTNTHKYTQTHTHKRTRTRTRTSTHTHTQPTC